MKVVQHKIYTPRPIYINRNNTSKEVNKHFYEYEVTNGDYYLVAFVLIVLIIILIRLIYKLFKNGNK